MKADDWRLLGKALQDNAELLETMAGAYEAGVPEPEALNKSLAWLLTKGLIECEENTLHIGGPLLEISSQVSMPGFERAALDLQEALISIQQHCEGYLAAKKENAFEDMDKHQKRLGHTTRQITRHLHDEYISTRHFIEGGIGYSSRPSERLRDIHNAIERLRRLHQKVLLFSYRNLSRLAQGDRSISKLLIGTHSTSLHASIQRRRINFTGLIDRLDTLSLSVRKRNRFRQVMQAIESHTLAGNSLELMTLVDDPKATRYIPAARLPIGGYVQTPQHAGMEAEAIEQVMASLPPPPSKKQSQGALSEETKRVVKPVPVKGSTKEVMEVPFARDHLRVMINQLIEQGKPQSAVAYWQKHGDPEIEARLWLYALDYYVQLQIALAEKKGKRINYTLVPCQQDFRKGAANRQVYDLRLEVSRTVGA